MSRRLKETQYTQATHKKGIEAVARFLRPVSGTVRRGYDETKSKSDTVYKQRGVSNDNLKQLTE